MSQLTYMSKRGAGVGHFGTAKELGERMKRLRARATLRSDHGAVIGTVEECDGACFDPNCLGWNWWYDPTGDDVKPDPEAEEVSS
jgi:hypothetical protein